MNIITAIREEILVPIHPAGWPFIGAFAVVSAIITALWTPFWPFGLALTLWCVYFFRNPPRTIPQKPGWIIAPADGRVISVDEAEVPEELDLPEGSYRRIAIFMKGYGQIHRATRTDRACHHRIHTRIRNRSLKRLRRPAIKGHLWQDRIQKLLFLGINIPLHRIAPFQVTSH